jgi:hypothetical protein
MTFDKKGDAYYDAISMKKKNKIYISNIHGTHVRITFTLWQITLQVIL